MIQQERAPTNEYKMFYIDTHKTVTSLVKTGFDTKQAEAIVETFCEARRGEIEHLATKEDLKKVEDKLHRLEEKVDRLDEKVDKLEARLDERIDKLEARLDRDFATKEDLKKLEIKMTHEMRELKSDLIAHMHKMEATIKTWLLSFMLTISVAFIAAIVKMVF
jgi:hypothetical protein